MYDDIAAGYLVLLRKFSSSFLHICYILRIIFMRCIFINLDFFLFFCNFSFKFVLFYLIPFISSFHALEILITEQYFLCSYSYFLKRKPLSFSTMVSGFYSSCNVLQYFSISISKKIRKICKKNFCKHNE